MAINIVEAPMGAGKTTMATARMSRGGPWVYAAPFLAELTRVHEACPRGYFQSPQPLRWPSVPRNHNSKSKKAHLLHLLRTGQNVAITHALLQKMATARTSGTIPEALQYIRNNHYQLMLDEEPAGLVRQTAKGAVSILPPELLTSFQEATILTFMLDGSYLKSWLDLHGIEYERRSIVKENGRCLMDFYKEETLEDFKAKVRELVHVVGDSSPPAGLAPRDNSRLNKIGVGPGSKPYLDHDPNPHILSTGWWQGGDLEPKIKAVGTKIASFLRRHKQSGTGNGQAMWSCLKGKGGIIRDSLVQQHLTLARRNWLPLNAKAINSFRDRANLAYIGNIYPSVPLDRYFRKQGHPIDRDAYALSQLLQWVFRSRVREGQPVSLYLPSSRMRSILREWTNTSLTGNGAEQELQAASPALLTQRTLAAA